MNTCEFVFIYVFMYVWVFVTWQSLETLMQLYGSNMTPGKLSAPEAFERWAMDYISLNCVLGLILSSVTPYFKKREAYVYLDSSLIIA